MSLAPPAAVGLVVQTDGATRCGKMAFRVRSALTGLLAWLSRTNKLHLTPLVRPMLQYEEAGI